MLLRLPIASLIVFFLLPAAVAVAQTCMPLDSIPGGGPIYPLPYTQDMPENGIPDTACVNKFYATTFSIRIPDTVNFPVIGQAQIDSVVIAQKGAVKGLPASFSYGCNQGKCTFYPDSLGCITIYGRPTAADARDQFYNLKMDVKLYVKGFPFPVDYTLPDQQLAPGEYRLFVRPENFRNCFVSGTTEYSSRHFALRLQPNPVADVAWLTVESQINTQANLRIFDALGQPVIRQQVLLQAGENQLQLQLGHLPTGFYVYTLERNGEAVSGRLLINR